MGRMKRTDIIRMPDRYDGKLRVGEIEYQDCKALYKTWADRLDKRPYFDRWCDGEKSVAVGGGGPAGCVELLGFGDPKGYAESRKLMRDIERIDFSNLERQFVARPRGSSPIVGAYLAGNPACMHAWDDEEGAGPIRIWYSFDAAQGYTPAQLQRRGFAVAALGLALSRVRPVELFAWFANNPGWGGQKDREGLLIVRMGISPFDSGRIGAMCNPAFLRRFGFVALRRVWGWDNLSGGEGIGASNFSAAHYIESGPDDIVIGRAQHRGGDPMLDDPIAWVQRKVNESLGLDG